jgi:predicted metalloprotease
MEGMARMKRLLLTLAGLALVLAACGDDSGTPFTGGTSATTAAPTTLGGGNEYPQEIIDGYIEGCTQDGPEDFCRCSIDEFQKRLTLGEFIELAGTDDITSDPVAQEIIDFCLLGNAPPTTGSAATTVPPTTGGFVPITDMETIIDLSIQDLEIFWADQMPDTWGVGYTPITQIGPYFNSQGDIPECGGPLPQEAFVGNAFYCSLNDSVRWDAEDLMAPLFQEFGDFTVALVMAHEWGHAVQERFGFDDSLPTIISELQADCLAGAWTAYVDSEQSELLRLEPGDLEEGMAGFLLIGDQLGSAPEGPNAHGGSFDRLTAFFDGFNFGPGECATYDQPDTPPDVVFIPLLEGEDPNEGGDLPYADTAPILADALEVFWGIVYPDLFGQEWIPLSGQIPYAPSTGNFPSCGGTVFDRAFYEGNAFYCPADDYIAWDDEQFFPDLYQEIGDFAIGLVLANEYGRAVQNRAGLPMDTVGAQLQVDCLTGVFTAAMTFDDNPMELFLSAGDLEEGIAGFLTLSGTPGETDSATAFQRFEAFKDGFFEGSTACGV